MTMIIDAYSMDGLYNRFYCDHENYNSNANAGLKHLNALICICMSLALAERPVALVLQRSIVLSFQHQK